MATTILIGLVAVTFLMVGFTLAVLVMSHRITELQDQLGRSFTRQQVFMAIHSSVIPQTGKRSQAWNAALLDIIEKLGLEGDDGAW
ncbi:hypothetical protein [Faecalibaculum rodentium]|uniref:hypothetical protein n=1 Tax=Faecalibaculum rodentium TaxID=1702221 RepID=UPI0023F48672|nr:hypothetical protein [Faecalibaculum rodentium]